MLAAVAHRVDETLAGAGDPETSVAILFAVSGLLTVVGQVRLTAWVQKRWTPRTAIVRGLWLMAASFLPSACNDLVGSRPVRARPWRHY